MKLTLRLTGLCGVLLFGAIFGFTFGVPGGVEDVARDFIKQRIELETGERIDSLEVAIKDTRLGQLAQSLLQGHQDKVAALRQQLRDKAYENTAAVIARMRDLSCECRKQYAQRLKQGIESQLTLLEAGNARLVDFLQYKYMEVVTRLSLDLRIFSATNLALFALLLILSFAKPRAIAHLFLPGVLLFVSTAVCTFYYLFEQNWFFTIIYNDYVGLGYLGYVSFLFLLLCDIVINGARITAAIINWLARTASISFEIGGC